MQLDEIFSKKYNGIKGEKHRQKREKDDVEHVRTIHELHEKGHWKIRIIL